MDGDIVREVSDEDGLCGMYQDEVHEVSGRPVIDANKMALRLLEERADRYPWPPSPRPQPSNLSLQGSSLMLEARNRGG